MALNSVKTLKNNAGIDLYVYISFLNKRLNLNFYISHSYAQEKKKIIKARNKGSHKKQNNETKNIDRESQCE